MAHVEYSELSDPEYLSYERKGCYSYIKDQVGTITKVYKHETKQMINTRTYDTFGNLVSQTGSSTGKLGFQSKYYDEESGLNYYYHRYYYPSIGRFINEDPIGMQSSFNLYNFLNNNPNNFFDPFGLECKINGTLSYDISVFPKIIGIDDKIRINPGGKFGIGLGGLRISLIGSIDITLVCERKCDNGECDNEEKWEISGNLTINKTGTIGIGFTFTPINYTYNIPKGLKDIIKTLNLSLEIRKYIRELKNILDAIKDNSKLLELLCEWSR